MKRVGVFGLLPRQAAALTAGVSGRAEVVYLGGRHNPLRSGRSDLDAVVLVTRFAGHREHKALLARYGRHRLHLVRGGPSAVRARIEALCSLDSPTISTPQDERS